MTQVHVLLTFFNSLPMRYSSSRFIWPFFFFDVVKFLGTLWSGTCTLCESCANEVKAEPISLKISRAFSTSYYIQLYTVPSDSQRCIQRSFQGSFKYVIQGMLRTFMNFPWHHPLGFQFLFFDLGRALI